MYSALLAYNFIERFPLGSGTLTPPEPATRRRLRGEVHCLETSYARLTKKRR
ncbi:hypothetical protein M427DRAFT_62603 [Gonapodya prolifera JEL478]|uniref:Uncharacterized protein n=1 Tax=Gonapodya prolifera (strain JEL478) TaxID=1344416 RepID=A0A139A099_GONPJ|nr:hypothetical protein M427DRAFT_62603 [Gonapodya prolifera JEL478]|eukprot:KXS10190.1 hypothetical protein M427DRAFT_62603 [Gonapodya prolifera JEL478]